MSATVDTQHETDQIDRPYDVMTLRLEEIQLLAEMIDGMEGFSDNVAHAALLARIIVDKVTAAREAARAVDQTGGAQ